MNCLTPAANKLTRVLLLASGAMVLCGCSGQPASSPTVSVSPGAANVSIGEKAFFTAAMQGSAAVNFAWEVNGIPGGNAAVGTIVWNGAPGGTIGVYTAPSAIPNPSSVNVTAISQGSPGVKGNASAKIGPLISISPAIVSIQTFQSQQFSATVTGVANTAVTWQVSCQTGGTACGAISPAGLYQAPNSVPTKTDGNARVKDSVSVTASWQTDPAFSKSVPFGVVSLNQQAQGALVQLGTSGWNANEVCVVNNSAVCSTGTLGALLARGGKQYILSASHVLAGYGTAAIGDPVIQPGLRDTFPQCSTAGTTVVGHLSQYTNLQASGATVDAAIAEVVSGTVDPNGLIEELGETVVNGVPQAGAPASGTGAAPSLQGLVAKSGRTTGVTCSKIEAVDVVFTIQYQMQCPTASFTVAYSGQVAIGGAGFGAQGDSGALIVDGNTAQPVALIIGGDTTTSIANPVAGVLNALKDASNNVPTFVGGAPHPVAACSLPPPKAMVTKQAAATATAEALQMAAQVTNRRAAELLSRTGVAAVGTGSSLDEPGSPAVLIFVQKGAERGGIPAEIEGVRTRIIERQAYTLRGLLDETAGMQMASETEENAESGPPSRVVEEAIAIKNRHVGQLMKETGIEGVGVSASRDNPSEAALILYVRAGVEHAPIPATIGGLRTRLKETTGFRIGMQSSGSRKGCTVMPAKFVSGPARLPLAKTLQNR